MHNSSRRWELGIKLAGSFLNMHQQPPGSHQPDVQQGILERKIKESVLFSDTSPVSCVIEVNINFHFIVAIPRSLRQKKTEEDARC